MSVMRCPCGEDHDVPEWLAPLIAEGGETVRVAVAGSGAWKVPRLFIQQHGLKAAELPRLAETYGFEPTTPGPLAFMLDPEAGE